MKHALLLAEPMIDDVETQLSAEFDVYRLHNPADAPLIEQRLNDFRVVATGGGVGISTQWVERLPLLKVIAINGVGLDKVDLAHAGQRGIHVTNTPGVLTGDVADLAMGLIIATLRHMNQGEKLVRSGQWAAGSTLPLGTRLAGKTVGILGLGQIGQAIARRAAAFDMQIAYWNRSAVETPQQWERVATPEELAAKADILMVAIAANPATQGLVSSAMLAALGRKGFLVNVSRGSVVDEAALITALTNGTIAGAGLDVFWNEPAINPVFGNLDNVVLMPHQGSATGETKAEMGRIVLANIAAAMAGEIPPASVNAALIRRDTASASR
ncbi:2-hydroxyacid dehydrogenase [Aureimonas fodinaquatilis]|uniref:2-hydroxyacid dehydrogenase n=1 Tax=Aureimonas fodinaquatilis TaxID=2565783 RepID=A0A5B0DUF9_9HYPH|nr:2-hydroxyacid dehydrogenase [Aureimonas fodinaquatilis]KAA0969411.1 2-hydroxyacid dehydrogenase [Aureimonas fodinaquatilis]